jgi:predicted dehydrogenase
MMVKIGLLGAGFAADFHMQAYRQIQDAEIYAVASRKRAKEFASKWGIKKCYTGGNCIERLCKDDQIEAVDITLPTFVKLEAVQAASERGKDVMVEKPFGRNAKEARGMVDAVTKHKVLHGYAENQLFFPQVERAMEIRKNGTIGKVFWVRSREAHFGPHSPWFWDGDLAGGGVLREMGCHSIEACRKIIGA